ncbi:ATP-binding cassette domain-containing protein [Austwickia chelonae]|uniref:ATP-binding cassette domain-containing protein n=1 Tax=Austwickia chelonae TaxID=100225 RepID=UPI000E241210|nr:ATP-binding cassette domain-containing protein [Austwickia chelonae]
MSIRIADVTKDFPSKPRAIDHLTTTFQTGMTGLLGANGAGKTTLMRIVCGILRPTSGEVFVDGASISQNSALLDHKRHLGYLPQDLMLYGNLTPREFLEYVSLLKEMTDRRRIRREADELIERVGLADVADRRIGGFSGGMRRRVGIAQALTGDPRTIVVDEPTAGLDPEERMRFRSLLSTLGGDRTVILSTHILDDVAQTCPRVCVMREGRILYSGPTVDLVHHGEGVTYLLIAPGPPPEGMHVVNAVSSASGTLYRVVGSVPPAGARPVEPTIEDGYIAVMNRVCG